MTCIKRFYFVLFFLILFSTLYGIKKDKPSDLQVTSLTLGKSESCSQCSVDVNFSIRNTGGLCGPFNVDVYFARDVTRSFIKAENRVIQINLRRMTKGQTLVFNRKFRVPAGTRNGRYFVTVKADPDKNIVESNENNNAKSAQLQIVSQTFRIAARPMPRADLVVRNLTISNEDVYPGQSLRVQFSIHNTGDADCNRTMFKIAVKATVSPLGATLATLIEENAGFIRKGGMTIVDKLVSIPKYVAPGANRSIWVMADSIRRVPEKNEDNNIAVTAMDVLRPPCDLMITSVSREGSGRFCGGEEVTVNYTESNSFSAKRGVDASDAGLHYIKIYFVYKNTPGGRDREVVLGTMRVSRLAGETQRDFTQTFTLPEDPIEAYHKIKVVADWRNQVVEYNEDNNSKACSVWISVRD